MCMYWIFVPLGLYETPEEKSKWDLHKNTALCFEQILEAAPTKHQFYGHLPPITQITEVRRVRYAGHC